MTRIGCAPSRASLIPTRQWHRPLAWCLPILLLVSSLAVVFASASPASAADYLDWEQLAPTQNPPARASDQIALDENNGTIIMYGGADQQLNPTTGTWAWDGSDWTQLITNTVPAARQWASLAWDPITDSVLMFGGTRQSGLSNPQTWSWDGSDWTQLSPATTPVGRSYGAMAFDENTNEMVLFGGYQDGPGGAGNDTWTWDGNDWTEQFPGTAPSGTDHPSMAFDDTNNQLVLLTADAYTTGSTYVWTGVDWADMAPAQNPVGAVSLAFDQYTGELIAGGGSQTWSWSGTNWVEVVTPTTPTPVYNTSMAYSPNNLGVLRHGGYDPNAGGWTDQTWLLGPHPATVPTAPLNVQATSDGTIATVTFDPPSSDGHDPIYEYMVTASPGGETVWGASSPITFDSLESGDYTFTVTATNTVGDGSLSLPSNSVTITAPPPGPPYVYTPTPAFSIGGQLMVVVDGVLSPLPNFVPAGETVVGATVMASGQGAWAVTSTGGVFTGGDAPFYGSTGDLTLNQPIVGIAPLPDDSGYWLVASDGGIFAFGDAAFYGSTGALTLNKPIVGMVSTPTGLGYWLIASDGGVFTFGDAAFYGSTGDLTLNQPIVGLTTSQDGTGYWFVAADGGVFTFGTAQFFGSLGGTPGAPVVGITAGATTGYSLVRADGTVADFGVS